MNWCRSPGRITAASLRWRWPLGGKVAGRGQGHSKKEAEQAAARAALESMQETEHL